MKTFFISLISFAILFSCTDSQKKDKQSIKIKSNSTKTIKKIMNQENAVEIDKNGIANIIITSNDEMKFDVNKIKVKPGQKIKLTLKHTGQLDKRIMGHNVVVLKNGVKLPDFAAQAAASADNDYIPKGTTDVIAYTKMIGGGETTEIEFTAPEAGTYDFICSFPGHYALMRGKFIVQ